MPTVNRIEARRLVLDLSAGIPKIMHVSKHDIRANRDAWLIRTGEGHIRFRGGVSFDGPKWG